MHAFRRSALILLVPSSFMAAVGCSDASMSSGNTEGPSVYQPGSAPSALILSPDSGDSLTAGDSWTLVGRVSDADSPAGELRASWSYGGVELCTDVVPQKDGIVTCEASGTPGKGDITLSVVDADGLESASSVGITVEASEAPALHVDSISQQAVYSDVPLSITGVASGAGDITVAVRSHQDGELAVELAKDGSFAAAETLTPGDHVITVTVTDGYGSTVNAGITVYVEGPNTVPNCSLLSPVSGDPSTTGTPTALTAVASDADVGAAGLRVLWSSSIDGYLGGGEYDPTTGESELAVVLSEGTHSLQFIATDEVGATCTDTVTHVVGTAPGVALSAPVGLLNEGESEAIIATVTGAVSLTGSTVVRWSAGGELYDISSTDVNGVTMFDTAALPGGKHTVVASVRDSQGWESTGTVDVVINARPTTPVVSGGGVVSSTEDLVVTLDEAGSDPEGRSVTHSYTWFLNGSATSATTTDTFPAAATVRGDSVVVEVAANDGRIDSELAVVSFEVGNTEPTATAVSFSPAYPSSSDTLSCTGTAEDADGDMITTSYAWFVGNKPVGEGRVLPAGSVPGGEAVFCVASFDDGLGRTELSSAPAVLAHSAPLIVSASLSETNPTSQSVLSVTATGSDVDRDTISFRYDWMVNGAPAGSGSVLTSSISAGDEVSVEVTAYDEFHTGGSTTLVTSIGEADILAPEVSIGPEEAGAGDDLVCSIDVEGVDLDSGSVTHIIQWRLNGELWTDETVDGAEAGDTIDGSFVSMGDEWSCDGYATDGTRHSDPGSDTIQVGAARPTAFYTLDDTDLVGADDTCSAGEAVVDGSEYSEDVDASYFAAPLPSDSRPKLRDVDFTIDLTACNADDASDANVYWGIYDNSEGDFIAGGSEPISADGGCTCPDGDATTMSFVAQFEEGVSPDELELRMYTDADELAVIPSVSGSYLDVTYTW